MKHTVYTWKNMHGSVCKRHLLADNKVIGDIGKVPMHNMYYVHYDRAATEIDDLPLEILEQIVQQMEYLDGA